MFTIIVIPVVFTLRCTGIDSNQDIPVTDAILNDGYCDCVSGIDEPLTSACYKNEFTCIQKDAKPKTIGSWLVDDLVCDCCDGMDESTIKCPNTCQELGIKQDAIEKMQQLILSEGLKNRETLIKKATAALEKDKLDLKRKQLHLNKLGEGEESLLDLVNIWTKKKKISDFQKDKRRREQCPEIEKLEAAQDSIALKEGQLTSLKEKFEGISQEFNQLRAKVAESIVSGTIFSQEELDKFEVESAEKVQYHNDEVEPDHEKNFEALKDSQVDTNTIDESNYAHDLCPATIIGLGLCVPEMFLDYLPEFIFSSSPSSLNSKFVQSKLDQHQKYLDDHLEKQSALRKEISDIQERINKDFGPNRVWQGLYQICVSFDDIEYLYEVCLFGNAKQKSKKDSTEISLGKFVDYKDRSDRMNPNYSTMMYKYGVTCWNGPSRSVQVDFECGTTLKLTSVEEPQRCEYVIKGESPAVCLDSKKVRHDEL